MQYLIIAHENTRARLIASETRTDNKAVLDMVTSYYDLMGFIVVVRTEE